LRSRGGGNLLRTGFVLTKTLLKRRPQATLFAPVARGGDRANVGLGARRLATARRGGHGDAHRIVCVLVRVVVQSEFDRTGLSDRTHAVVVLAPRPGVAAAGISTARRVPSFSAPGLFELPGFDLVYAAHDRGSRDVDGHLDRLYLCRKSSERSASRTLSRRRLSRILPPSAGLPRAEVFAFGTLVEERCLDR